MRRIYTALLLLLTSHAWSQQIKKFYDFSWKETEANKARFFSIIEKTDSGWFRQDYYIRESSLQMKGLYEDSSCKIPSGFFAYFHPNKLVESYGNYRHGKKQGTWMSTYSDGSLADSTFYENGNPTGTRFSWHRNGYLSDSAVFEPDGSGVEVAWFDNGSPSFAGRYAPGFKQNGKWKYFHSNGQVSALELYENGKLVDKQYFDKQGAPVLDTTNKDSPAVFPGGQKAWSKYLSRSLYFPDQYKIVNGDQAAVVVSATISEDGKVQDVEVTTSFHPSFDKIAVTTLRRSPDWIPAIQHNRKIKDVIRQPVIFSQPE